MEVCGDAVESREKVTDLVGINTRLGLRITSGRLYSTWLLQLNLSMALQRTLNHISSVQQKHRADDRSDHPSTSGDYIKDMVHDRASGVAGEFAIVEQQSDRQRRVSQSHPDPSSSLP